MRKPFFGYCNQVRPIIIYMTVYICLFQGSALKKKLGMVGCHNYFIKIFLDIAFFTTFSPIFSIFDYIFLKIHNKRLMIWAKT